jgi:hypothetical protein
LMFAKPKLAETALQDSGTEPLVRVWALRARPHHE